jgi:hypothetical protein
LHSLEDLPKLEEFAEMISSKEAESIYQPSEEISSPENADVAQEQTSAEKDNEPEDASSLKQVMDEISKEDQSDDAVSENTELKVPEKMEP